MKYFDISPSLQGVMGLAPGVIASLAAPLSHASDALANCGADKLAHALASIAAPGLRASDVDHVAVAMTPGGRGPSVHHF